MELTTEQKAYLNKLTISEFVQKAKEKPELYDGLLAHLGLDGPRVGAPDGFKEIAGATVAGEGFDADGHRIVVTVASTTDNLSENILAMSSVLNSNGLTGTTVVSKPARTNGKEPTLTHIEAVDGEPDKAGRIPGELYREPVKALQLKYKDGFSKPFQLEVTPEFLSMSNMSIGAKTKDALFSILEEYDDLVVEDKYDGKFCAVKDIALLRPASYSVPEPFYVVAYASRVGNMTENGYYYLDFERFEK